MKETYRKQRSNTFNKILHGLQLIKQLDDYFSRQETQKCACGNEVKGNFKECTRCYFKKKNSLKTKHCKTCKKELTNKTHEYCLICFKTNQRKLIQEANEHDEGNPFLYDHGYSNDFVDNMRHVFDKD
jgi:hypothetical protein